MAFSLQKAKERVTTQDVFEILEYFGADPEERSGDVLVSRTVSHGGESKKLFYYGNTQLFVDYTNGGDKFDVFELVSRLTDTSLSDAIWFVVSFLHMDGDLSGDAVGDDWRTFERYDELSNVNTYGHINLPSYDKCLLDNYPKVTVSQWEREHIPADVQDEFDVRFNPVDCSILIPHYDVTGDMVGVRKRALVEDDMRSGKYRPATILGKMRNHPLAFNLYGIDKAAPAIRESGLAVVAEGEKSVMQSHAYGIPYTVACCGSSISMHQVMMLLECGAREMAVAFDSDYDSVEDDEARAIADRLLAISHKASPYLRVTFIWDKDGLLGYKDSPFDKGEEVFKELWAKRLTT